MESLLISAAIGNKLYSKCDAYPIAALIRGFTVQVNSIRTRVSKREHDRVGGADNKTFNLMKMEPQNSACSKFMTIY